MNTTNLIVEFLIIGIQTSSWIVLLFLCFFGLDWISWDKIKEIGVPVIGLILSISYPLGVIIDNSADLALSKLVKPLKNFQEEIRKSPIKSVLRLRTLAGDSALTSLFEYQRSRIRITRSTFLNSNMIALFCFLNAYVNFANLKIFLVSGLLAVLISVFSFYTWKKIMEKFLRYTVHSYEILQEMGKVPKKDSLENLKEWISENIKKEKTEKSSE